MLKNGISKNDVVTVGILDPGAWATEEEGRRSWRSFTDANRISHQTSLTIIDRFSERDLADGGSGFPLLPLSYWFLRCLGSNMFFHISNRFSESTELSGPTGKLLVT